MRVKDAPLRNSAVTLVLTKRRFFCKPCRKPFTQYIPGVKKGRRSTERYRSFVLWACENFTDLKRVRKMARCSAGFLYGTLYEQLELRLRKRQYPWPPILGIDEHSAVWEWLNANPEIKNLYVWKERLHGFYRIKGYERAGRALTAMTDELAGAEQKELKTLRRTLMRWRKEILNYFKTGLTNARTEGFNNLAKLVQRRAFAYKNFQNYRLRLLNACA